MPVFKPFRGIRPNPDLVDVFPSYSLDNFTQEEINKSLNKMILTSR